MKKCCALLCALIWIPASAHLYQAGLTDLSSNARSGALEVVHTFMAHDMEPLLAARAGRQIDLARPADEAVLRAYVEQRFYLLDADGRRLPLRWVGVELKVDSVVIYQELPATPLARVAAVHHAVLSDALPAQVNTLNVRRAGTVSTYRFERRHQERTIAP